MHDGFSCRLVQVEYDKSKPIPLVERPNQLDIDFFWNFFNVLYMYLNKTLINIAKMIF